MTVALAASVSTLVLWQISLADEDKKLAMSKSDGLVIAAYTAALAAFVGYLFSYVLASIFRQQRWARLPKMPKAPLKATAQLPRRPLVPKAPKPYFEFTGETVLMAADPEPSERGPGAYAASASDDDADAADAAWRVPQGYDGGSSEEEVG